MSEEPQSRREYIDAKRAELAELHANERRIGELRKREAELEVEKLLSDSAVDIGLKSGRPAVPPEEAVAIVALAERIEQAQAERLPDTSASSAEASHLQAAVEALTDWLEAPEIKDSARVALVTRVIVLVLTVLALWAALQLHPAFLLLLIPIGAPLTLLFRRGENTAWRRLGARRQFERTGLAPPEAWTEEAVEQRRRVLGEAADRVRPASPDAADAPVTGEDTAPELAGDRQELALRLAGLGESSLDEELGAWLKTLSKAELHRRELAEVRRTRDALTGRADAVREEVFRFLARHGAAPAGGSADPEALSEGLERLRG